MRETFIITLHLRTVDSMDKKYVYLFSEGNKGMKALLGGKGANLAEMTNIGLRVPQGFTITTEACNSYRAGSGQFPTGLWSQIKEAMMELEKTTGKGFGDRQDPLLVSVRSGAVVSMPGMMDTILNLGLNDETVEGLAKKAGNRRFALDCYRRLIQMFSDVVLEIDLEHFENRLQAAKDKLGVKLDIELDEKAMEKLVKEYLKIVKDATGKPFPTRPMEQLEMAVKAVFDSWDNPRANTYRRLNDIPDDLGTAVNVQQMVFGNIGQNSATGVAFTRNPSSGAKEYYGEYLLNAQGEDVVAGIRTPKPVSQMAGELPEIFEELQGVYHKLEDHYKDMQDFEFTVEEGILYILQTRNGKRTASAAVNIAVDMVEEGLITKEEAIMLIDPKQISQLLHSRIDPTARINGIGKGLPASPGAAVGRVVFTADDAEEWGKRGERVILVREETKPDDIHGFFAAQGILTARGGKTSHAAVVARGMGKPCVSGCESMKIDNTGKSFTISETVINEGDYISIDGTDGVVMLGEVPTIAPELSPEARMILRWADKIRKLGVWANASTPQEARDARKFGAQGIGLCRTERMFNASNRLPIVVSMILAVNDGERQKALDKLLPFQTNDFMEIFKIMEGSPVVVRLLDIPLHEFLPSTAELTVDVQNLTRFLEWLKSMKGMSAAVNSVDLPEDTGTVIRSLYKETEVLHEQDVVKRTLEQKQAMLAKVEKLQEVNPMLGHRGVRLGITYPQIYQMQIRAICEAAAQVIKEGRTVQPKIMIPQVCTVDELRWVKEMVDGERTKAELRYGVDIPLELGTMIEVVRSCMRAGRIAEIAQFFSFGTNDLTQAVFSFSREDAENTFLPLYNDRKILQDNPFEVLDQKGVGQLMQITVEWGRKTKPDLQIGICGEHGGEPKSIGFVHTIGIDYVSCSPYRVPVAKIAAAQAALKKPEELSKIWGRNS